jgi:predicted AAA+ superfamily ATPase
MLRSRISDLNAWSERSDRKPLVLRGARQVGKSWLVRTWGAQRFGRVVEVNLERRPEIAACFTANDPAAVLQRLEVHLSQRIPADGSVLLFLDEIQALPEVLPKLRWFAEEMPQLPVIAAGSLLDFVLAEHRFSMPVGRISYLHVEPMGFLEFCHACGEERLARWLEENLTLAAIRSGVPATIHEQASGLFRSWVLVGGMPAAVDAFARERSYLPVADVHRELLATVRDDFAKYADRVHHRRLTAVLDSVPNQLGQKFTFAKVDRDERSAALRQALDLLTLSRVCHRVVSTPGTGLPLGAGADAKTMKVIHLDVGLASSALRLDLAALERADDLDLVNGGAIAEQAIGQLLRLIGHGNEEPALWYWSREARSSAAEVDYLAAPTGHVLPIEVKAGAGGAMRSLHLFMAERKLPWAARFNSAAPMVQDVSAIAATGKPVRYRLLSLPAYAVECLQRLAREMDAETSGS